MEAAQSRHCRLWIGEARGLEREGQVGHVVWMDRVVCQALEAETDCTTAWHSDDIGPCMCDHVALLCNRIYGCGVVVCDKHIYLCRLFIAASGGSQW